MHAEGYDVQLQQYPHGWRASFTTTGIAHSVVAGWAYEPAPWTAVQSAAWEALIVPQASDDG